MCHHFCMKVKLFSKYPRDVLQYKGKVLAIGFYRNVGEIFYGDSGFSEKTTNFINGFSSRKIAQRI